MSSGRQTRSDRTSSDWRTWAVALGVVGATVAVNLPFRAVSINIGDEGLMMQVASDLLAGRRLYADAVVYAWPGSFYLTALAFAVFGESVEVARTLAILVFAVATGAVFLMARWFHGTRAALAWTALFVAYRVWAYPHWQMINYSSVGMGLVLVAVWLAGEALARPHRGWPLAAGIAAGLAALAKQDIGLASTGLTGVAFLAMLPRERRWRWAFAFGLGLLVPLGLCVAHLAWEGTLGVALHETVWVPMQGMQGFVDYPGRPALRPLLAQDPALRERIYGYAPAALLDLHWHAINPSWLYRQTAIPELSLKLLFFLPWLTAAGGAAWLAARAWRRAGGPPDVSERRVGLLVLLVVASQVAFNPPRDWIHLMILYPPTLVLLGALKGVWRPRSRAVRRAAGAFGFVALATVTVVSATLAVQLRRHHAWPVQTARGTLFGPRVHAEPLQALVDDLARDGTGPLQVLPYHPLVYFLTGRRTPTRHYIIWPAEDGRQRDREIIEGLERHPGTPVVYCPMQVPYYPRPDQYAGELVAYLADHYQAEKVYEAGPSSFVFVLGRPAPPPAPSVIDVTALEAHARFVPLPQRPHQAPVPGPTDRLASVRFWPFARTLEVSLYPDAWLEVITDRTVLAGDRFTVVVATAPDDWGRPFEPAARFAVDVDEDGRRTEVATIDVNPNQRPADRRWIELTADLSPWVGKRVALVLRAMRIGGLPGRVERAGWAAPRIERRSEAAQSQVE